MYRECREYDTPEEFCDERWMVQSAWSGAQRPSKSKSKFERVESDMVSIQSTTSLHLQPPETSQPTPASTLLLRRHRPFDIPQTQTPVTSGSEVEPIVIPLKVATNPSNSHSNSPAVEGGLFHYDALPLSQPSYGSHYVRSSFGTTHMDLDSPSTLPARVLSSKPPARTGWFGKSSSSSPAPS